MSAASTGDRSREGGGGSDAAPGPPVDAAVAAEWLGRLYELGRPATHEMRNALNGLAVNLEVVRSRSARPGAKASDVARFAEAAVEQLEAVSALAEDLLSFMRPVAEPVELEALVARSVALLGAMARGHGGAVRLTTVGPPDVPCVTNLSGDRARLAVTAIMLAAFEGAGTLSCELARAPRPTLRLGREDAAMPRLPESVARAAAASGVEVDVHSDGWVVRFPPVSAP